MQHSEAMTSSVPTEALDTGTSSVGTALIKQHDGLLAKRIAFGGEESLLLDTLGSTTPRREYKSETPSRSVSGGIRRHTLPRKRTLLIAKRESAKHLAGLQRLFLAARDEKAGSSDEPPPRYSRFHLICKAISDHWSFSLFSLLLTIGHCIALIFVANSAPDEGFIARRISTVCACLFVADFAIRVGGCGEKYIWNAGWLMYDAGLILSGIIENILRLYMPEAIGEGQYAIFSLRLFRVILLVPSPLAKSIAITAEALTTGFMTSVLLVAIALLMLVIIATLCVFLASEGDALARVNFSTLGPAMYTLYLKESAGLNWGSKVMIPLMRSGNTYNIIEGLFIASVATIVSICVTQSALCVYIEHVKLITSRYAEREAEATMLRTLRGIVLLENLLSGGSQKDALSSVISSFDDLSQTLEQNEATLTSHNISIDDCLLIYKALDDGRGVTISDLALGMLRLCVPTDSLDLLQIDITQQQSMNKVSRMNEEVTEQMSGAFARISDIDDRMLRLKSQVKVLRTSVGMATQRLNKELDMLVKIEDAIEKGMHGTEAMAAFNRRHAWDHAKEEVLKSAKKLHKCGEEILLSRNLLIMFGVSVPRHIELGNTRPGELTNWEAKVAAYQERQLDPMAHFAQTHNIEAHIELEESHKAALAEDELTGDAAENPIKPFARSQIVPAKKPRGEVLRRKPEVDTQKLQETKSLLRSMLMTRLQEDIGPWFEERLAHTFQGPGSFFSA